MFNVGLPDILDARLFYTSEEAMKYLTSLSSESLSSYIKIAQLDLIFIFVYSLLLFVSLKKVISTKWVGLLAAVPGILDLIETCNILTYLKNPTSYVVFGWLGYITCAKWMSGAIVVLTFIISFLRQRQLRSSDNQL